MNSRISDKFGGGFKAVFLALTLVAIPALSQVVVPPIYGRTPTPGLSILRAPAGSSVAVIYDLSNQGGNSASDLYGLMHTLDAFGIPYTVTTDLPTALLSPEMLFVAGRIEDLPSATLSTVRTGLLQWAGAAGHTLWMSAAKDPNLLAGLGLKMVGNQTTNERDVMYLDSGHALNTYADTPEEQEVWLAHVDLPVTVITRSYATNGSANWSAANVAHYLNGEGAVVTSQNTVTGGRAIFFGVKFSDLFIRMESILNKLHTRGSMNVFEPSTDTVRLWFRRAYELWTAHPFMRQFAPNGKKAAVILSHDMDATTAFDPLNTLYRPFEESLGVRSTIFETTSYRSNGWISAFYTKPEDQAILATVLAEGFDIQSHSVSHLPDMNSWQMGVDILDPSQYTPQYNTLTGVSTGGTVIPEMTISARFLKNDFGLNVRGWRSGHLTKPRYYGQLLGATGYSYDSSYEANRVGGTYPYVMMADNAGIAGDESQVLEIPLPISDSIFDTMTTEQAAATWLDITAKNASNNAPTVILVHPTHPEIKFAAYQIYLQSVLQNPDVWVGTMDAWYSWYRTQGIRSQQNAAPDTVSPTVALTAPTDGSTISGNVAVTATASDNIDVTKVEFYLGTTLLSTSSASPYSFNWDTTTIYDGTYQLTAKAYDATGNSTVSTPVNVNVSNGNAPPADVLAPTTTINCNSTSCSTGWYNSTTGINLTAVDELGGSGVASTRYTTDGSDPTLANGITYSGPFTVSQTTIIKFRSFDNAGNAEAVQTQTVQIDVVAPVTSITCNGSNCLAGWYTSAVTVALVATENLGESGIASTKYTTDGTDPTLANGTVYSSAFAVSQTTTIKYRSFDNAGNAGAVQSQTIQVDATAPSTAITCNGGACAVWYKAAVNVSLSATDNAGGSGVVNTRYTTDGTAPTLINGITYSGAFTVNATTTVKYRSWDSAGNAEAVQTKIVQIDQILPTVSITAPTNGSTVSSSGTTRVSANAADTGGSGVKSVSFYVDGQLQATVTSSPYSFQWNAKKSGVGQHSLSAISTDNANNNSTTATITVNVQ